MSERNSREERSYQYANSYFYFLKSLKILASDPLDQCREMGYFNVAWELRDDILRAGAAVLDSPEAQLSNDERLEISFLLRYLDDAPDEVVRVDNSREKHLESMNNPFWIPLRFKSKGLIDALSHETRRTNSILWPETDTSDPEG